jgi:hypothetical protein
MQITTLSNQLEQKLVELDQRLDGLRRELATSQDEAERHKLSSDLDALEVIKDKLIKSRDIAWRAYDLQQQTREMKQIRRNRWIGLTLCVISVLGGLILIGIIWWTEFR